MVTRGEPSTMPLKKDGETSHVDWSFPEVGCLPRLGDALDPSCEVVACPHLRRVVCTIVNGAIECKIAAPNPSFKLSRGAPLRGN